MPVISRFFGIVISMNYADHVPPHFHARYGEYEAIVGIDPVLVLRGRLPARVAGMIVEWASRHRLALAEDWERAQRHETLAMIAPLE